MKLSYKAGQKITLIILLGILLPFLLFHFTDFEKKIPTIVGVIYIIILSLAVFWSILRGLRVISPLKQTKNTLQKTAEVLGLEYGSLKGTEAVVAPLFGRIGVKGNYKNFQVSIRLIGESYFPITMPIVGLFLGYVGICIEVGPINVSADTPGVKRELRLLYIPLPNSLENMPYEFNQDKILIQVNKLMLEISRAVPKPNEIIFMIDTMIEEARKLEQKK